MISDETNKAVIAEAVRQDEKWGEQNPPDGTDNRAWGELATQAKMECDEAAESGSLTWCAILKEEVYEAFAEDDEDALMEELVQVAAVAQQWVDAIKRRKRKRAASGQSDNVQPEELPNE